MERTTSSSTLKIGGKLPEFNLKSTSGDMISESYFEGAKGALVIFTCNHCPYVKGSEKHLLSYVREYLKKGLKVVAVSANDPEKYPEDGFEKMKERALELSLPYPYLFDESQEVAKRFDAACTPECYLFNASLDLIYHGTINDSVRDPAHVKNHYLLEAIKQLFSEETVNPSYVNPIGCSIKWKV
jgi:peroxiredoxin